MIDVARTWPIRPTIDCMLSFHEEKRPKLLKFFICFLPCPAFSPLSQSAIKQKSWWSCFKTARSCAPSDRRQRRRATSSLACRRKSQQVDTVSAWSVCMFVCMFSGVSAAPVKTKLFFDIDPLRITPQSLFSGLPDQST